MTPLTPIGWILFVAMWVAGPVTGYVACNMIASARERRSAERRDVAIFGVFGGLLAIATTLLMLVDGL